jgi:hypothetical protein
MLRKREIENVYTSDGNEVKVTFRHVPVVWRGKHVFVLMDVYMDWQPDKCSCEDYFRSLDENDCTCNPETVWDKKEIYAVYHIGSGFRFGVFSMSKDKIIEYAERIDNESAINWRMVRLFGKDMNRTGIVRDELKNKYESTGRIIASHHRDVFEGYLL